MPPLHDHTWQPPPEHARLRRAIRARRLDTEQMLLAALEPIQSREDLDRILGPAIDAGHTGVVVFEGCGLNDANWVLVAESARIRSLNPAYQVSLVGDEHVVVQLRNRPSGGDTPTYEGIHLPSGCARADLLEDRIVRLEAMLLGHAPACGDSASVCTNAGGPARKRPRKAAGGGQPQEVREAR